MKSIFFISLLVTSSFAFGANIRETPVGPIIAVELHSDFSVKDCEKDFDGSQCQSDPYESKRNEFWKVTPKFRGANYDVDFHAEVPLTVGRKQYVVGLTCERAGILVLVTKNGWAVAPNKDITWALVSSTVSGLFDKMEQAGGCKSLLYRATAAQ
jgi:hypothetical protein